MEAVVDALEPLYVLVEMRSLACRILQPDARVIDVVPVREEVVLLRLDDVARDAVESFRRFARHVEIDFDGDKRRRAAH